MKTPDLYTLPLPLPMLTAAQQTAIEHGLVLLTLKCEDRIQEMEAQGQGKSESCTYWRQLRIAAEQSLMAFWPKYAR